MTGTEVRWEWLGYVWEHLGAPERSFGGPGSTWERRQQALEHQSHSCERRLQSWEHLESQQSSLGKTTFLGRLLVRMEIIATTHRSTIFKTHVFSLYSHQCIYVSIQLPIYTGYIWTGCRKCLWAIREASENFNPVSLEMNLEVVIGQIGRYT